MVRKVYLFFPNVRKHQFCPKLCWHDPPGPTCVSITFPLNVNVLAHLQSVMGKCLRKMRAVSTTNTTIILLILYKMLVVWRKTERKQGTPQSIHRIILKTIRAKFSHTMPVDCIQEHDNVSYQHACCSLFIMIPAQFLNAW